MKMASLPIKVVFPVFKYVAEVEHFTPRTPTAIERMVLRLIHDYQNEPVISSLFLLNVFEQQLGVADAMVLVSPSIQELKVLGVLERPQKDINAMSIADFRLSNDGKDFYRRNQLPGRSKSDTVEYLFDPLTQIWSTLKKSSFKPVISDIELDEESFHPGNPTEEIRRHVEQDDCRWKTSLTEIRNLDVALDEIQQNLQQLELTVHRDGNLFLEPNNSNPALQQWLKQVKPVYIRENILDIVLEIEDNEWSQLNSDSLNTAVITSPANASDISSAIKNCLPEKYFFTIGLENHAAFSEIDTPDLILTEELSELISWNDKGKPIAQTIEPKGLPEDLVALVFQSFGEPPVAVFLGVANLHWAGQPIKGLVATQQDSVKTQPIWEQIKAHLEDSIESSYNPKAFALALLWKKPELVISDWLSYEYSFEELLNLGPEFEQAMQQVAGTKINFRQQWQEALSEELSEKIALTESFDYQSLCNRINAINERLPSFKAKLHRELIAKTLPIKKQSEFLEVRRLVGTTLEFPESFIASSLVSDWVNCILSDKTIDLARPHAWVEDLEICKKYHQELIRNVGQKALDIAGEYEEISTGSISIKALASAKQWLQFSEVMKQHSEYVFEQTNLKRLTEQVNNWKSLMDRYMVEPLPKDQQWLVFDTCALMDFPDILDKLDKLKNIKLALPLKVLDELDNHKHDNRDEYQDRAITAQKIIKKIESLSGSITKIKHIPELLPHEHAKDPSADDMIISAARSLALSPVILVSSDVNFRNKANALELQVIATNDFIKKFFSIASSPAKPVQKQNHSKKGKKK
jgi:rRNA-processing protein FCF1